MKLLPNTKTMSPPLAPISRAVLVMKITIGVALFIPLVTLCQTPGRDLSGRVKAASGSPIPNARVSVKNLVSGDTFSAVTSEDGSYKLARLPPGNYDVSVSARGFASVRITVAIHADQDQVADLTLPSGNEQGTSSTVSGVVSGKNVSDLPLNGRSASDLATLEPGVASARTQTSGQAQRGFGNQMTISGGRPRQNDSRLDGISVNDYSNGPPGSALGVSLGSDGVEQFSVLTSNYPAQFGRSSGGIIGASTRSGTKEFHGSAFEYIRNSAFDARNFFDTAKPAFHRNQFGGSAGGPIWKDRTFIFGDYEGLRQSQGITQVESTVLPNRPSRRPAKLV